MGLVIVRAPRHPLGKGLTHASRFKPFVRRAQLVAPPADPREELLAARKGDSYDAAVAFGQVIFLRPVGRVRARRLPGSRSWALQPGV
ncbi:hypothetical protein [Streptomyces sp. NPDC002553]|uniref:hypothetical protein n=1 Tax=Streptomyces sp. NPDC002553 TaxID=3154417 RepID=UPI0033171A45